MPAVLASGTIRLRNGNAPVGPYAEGADAAGRSGALCPNTHVSHPRPYARHSSPTSSTSRNSAVHPSTRRCGQNVPTPPASGDAGGGGVDGVGAAGMGTSDEHRPGSRGDPRGNGRSERAPILGRRWGGGGEERGAARAAGRSVPRAGTLPPVPDALPPILDVPPMTAPVVVAGDVHLSPEHPAVADRFEAFLRGLAGPRARPSCCSATCSTAGSGRRQAEEAFARRFVSALSALARAGTRVAFQGGQPRLRLRRRPTASRSTSGPTSCARGGGPAPS